MKPLIFVLLATTAFAGGLPDLKDYRTVASAQTAKVQATKTATVSRAGYLGIDMEERPGGRLAVTAVAPGSPAEIGGLRAGDILLKLGDTKAQSLQAVSEWLLQREPGGTDTIQISRNGKKISLSLEFNAVSKPMKLVERPGLLGVRVAANEEGAGVRVTRVTSGLPAAQAGIKTGDILLKIDDLPLLSDTSLTDLLLTREAGETVKVVYRREDQELEFEAALAEDASEERGRSAARAPWRKPVFRLAVICVAFADTPPNPSITSNAWENFFFSRDIYRDTTNATGQPVYGSVNDYYREVSCGLFHFEGRVFDWVQMKKQRADYSQGTANSRTRTEFFKEAFDTLLEREGNTNLLSDFDGIAVIYAGERFPGVNRGMLFWPHRSTTTYQGVRYSYVICPEGGARMSDISTFCHEFGHILGLPDLYARPENPGSEGVGAWCAMSNHVRGGRPQHISAWCKERLGWLQPTVIDPTVKQKLILAPIENTTNQCFKVLLRPDGSEYLLLENRAKVGFDKSLAGAGLLIWRVVGERLILEESHGVEGPGGPRVFLSSVPYPSGANNAFTPYTTPSSRAQLGGGLPVFITHIQRLEDGRITFHIGYQYL